MTQTTLLKLDSVQAGCLGAGFLLCLAFQVAIVVVLLKQRHAQPVQIAAFPPGFERLLQSGDRSAPASEHEITRNTSIADFAANSGLLEGAAASISRKWQIEDDDLRLQEASIIEELVTKNVDWARELAQT